MPDHYPDYPSHKKVLQYFESYARHFDLYPYIRFNSTVSSVVPIKNRRWKVTLENEEEEFDFVLVANGHHSEPRHPELPGNFTGEYLHSHAYKTNVPFTNKKVLVIGGGNSACDCAVECSRVADFVGISMRRPQYIIPKFFLGKPTDTFNKNLLFLPKWLANKLRKISLKVQVGDYRNYHLENPSFDVINDHPTLNSELLYKIRHGDVHPRKGIDKIEENIVTFSNGVQEEYDVIIAATGYKIVTPFIDKQLLDYSEADRIDLFLRMFHPELQGLVFIGLVQPQGAVWPLSDLQSKLVANWIKGRVKLPTDLKKMAIKEGDEISRNFIQHKRHSVEVHYHEYARKLNKFIPKNAPAWADQRTLNE
jgi:cation diffusion facilitator CzcD-associated flavoprotein CzcO